MTTETIIKLNDVSDIKNFVEMMNRIEGTVSAYGGRYIVDAKSIMGIFSLDLSKPIKVEIEGEIPSDVRQGMEKYIERV